MGGHCDYSSSVLENPTYVTASGYKRFGRKSCFLSSGLTSKLFFTEMLVRSYWNARCHKRWPKSKYLLHMLPIRSLQNSCLTNEEMHIEFFVLSYFAILRCVSVRFCNHHQGVIQGYRLYIYIYIYIKGKVKFTLEQATKAERGRRDVVLLFL